MLKDQIGGGALLAQLAVDPGAQGQIMRIRDRLFADDPRADRRQGVAAFHPQVRAVVVFQIVADRVVIAHGIAGDIIHSLGFADAARGFSQSPPPVRLRSACIRRYPGVPTAAGGQ